LTLGESVFVIPDLLRRCTFLEEEQIGGDGCWVEGRLREADDGVEVAVSEQFLANTFLVSVPGDAAVGQNDSASTTGLKLLDK